MRITRIAGIVLASGVSRRFGDENKLLGNLAGQPLIRHTVNAFVEAGLDPVLVVLGYQSTLLEVALEGLPVSIIHNPEYREGQSRSLIWGIEALGGDVAAAVIGVGDQPFLQARSVADLAETYRRTSTPIVALRHAGRRINPVLFARSLFPELLGVTGDRGGREVVERHRDDISWIDVHDPRIEIDIDTPQDLSRASDWAERTREGG